MITDKKIDNVTQLQIIDDRKQITRKKSVITACNVDYRLKRSGPIVAYILSTRPRYKNKRIKKILT